MLQGDPPLGQVDQAMLMHRRVTEQCCQPTCRRDPASSCILFDLQGCMNPLQFVQCDQLVPRAA